MWASHHEERCSDRVVAPPVCDHMIVPHRWVVLDGCNPSGSAVDAGRDAAARARRAERVVEAVLCPFCRPSMGRPVHREFMRNELRNLTTIVSTTACHQRNDVETYSKFNLLTFPNQNKEERQSLQAVR